MFEKKIDKGISRASEIAFCSKMTQTRTRPIVFVAHSLGGVVLKSVTYFDQAARIIQC